MASKMEAKVHQERTKRVPRVPKARIDLWEYAKINAEKVMKFYKKMPKARTRFCRISKIIFIKKLPPGR